MTYEVYATTNFGDGRPTLIGTIDTTDLDDFTINVGTFASDVTISFVPVK